MKHEQNNKSVMLLPPQLKDDGDFANNTYLDTLGWSYAEFLIAVGATDVVAGDAIGSTAEGNALKIEECDTVGGSYTDVTDAVLADAIQYDDDSSFFRIDVALTKSHKRYMRVNAPHSAAGAANGSNLCITGRLSGSSFGPINATERGLAEHVIA